MLRCVVGFSSAAKSVELSAKRASAQIPYFLSSRSAFSSASKPSLAQGSVSTSGMPSHSGNLLPKLVIGTIVIGAAVGAAYQAGYIGIFQVKNEETFLKSSMPDVLNPTSKEHPQDGAELSHIELSQEKPLYNFEELDESCQKNEVEMSMDGASGFSTSEEASVSSLKEQNATKENDSSSSSQDVLFPEKEDSVPEISSMDNFEMGNNDKLSHHLTENDEITFVPISPDGGTATLGSPSKHMIADEEPKDFTAGLEIPGSLTEIYALQGNEKSEVPIHSESGNAEVTLLEKEKAFVGATNELVERNNPESTKIVLDFIEAIHAAEKRQAETDFRAFAEESQMLKDKFAKELKDAKARELMYAEEAAILEKELNKERVKAAHAAKFLQEKAEENLKRELQRMEEEMELKFKVIQEVGKAELSEAIAKEKSSHMEKMTEANLHIKALCMAFFARSEEARQSYSIHKLALGALALEDALSKGLPIKGEINMIHSSLEGLDKDFLLDMVLTTLPEETLKDGTVTLLQLRQKFDTLKQTLRHFGLIPPGGGGILAHTVAHIASSIKMKENNLSGDGIESIIARVERFLAEGKLAEAADALEKGVSGTEAEGAVAEWVKQAKNRAITEQVLTLLQAYAMSVSLS